ncbi:hypothetical protein L6R52_15320 [Myxococcota bacterium]|nr:hypothetical protein [Myxococcota bacterium]
MSSEVLLALALSALTPLACTDAADEGVTDLGAFALVTAPEGFYFYPPLAPAPAPSGTFDAGLASRLAVELVAIAPSGAARTVARFDTTTTPALALKGWAERYYVRLRLADHFTDRSAAHRFVIHFAGRELATADMPAEVWGFIDRNPRTDLTLSFRVERAAIDRDGDGVLDVDDLCPTRFDPSNAAPLAEACNGVDDDCDGVADDGDPGSGEPCATGLRGACANGTTSCSGGVITCVSPLPATDPACNLHDGSTAELAGPSCRSILAEGGGRGDGFYWIDPDGSGPIAPAYVLCDMSVDGGGWTLVARASDTNGVGGDYEFSAAFGARSLWGFGFTGGTPDAPQYRGDLDAILSSSAHSVDVMYACYDRRNPEATRYWAIAHDLPVATLRTQLTAANPDFLLTQRAITNADGVHATTGNFAFFGRESSGDARCGNAYAGQSGIKFDCAQSGQTVMTPRGVWMLTHYRGYTYTEVTSCGAVGGAVLPHYAGEVRVREHRCDDGLLDPGETDVDCGGRCGACEVGRACTTSSDCTSQVCAGGVCQAPTCTDGVMNGDEGSVDCGGGCGDGCVHQTCAAILAAGRSTGSGEYWLDADGLGTAQPVRAACDMTTDGGGWTLVARASDTNGFGGDYEFRAAFGAHSLLGATWSGGAPSDPQYTRALASAIPTDAASIELQYYCYDRRSPATTTYWAKALGLSRESLVSLVSGDNPDFSWTPVRLRNADRETTSSGAFNVFGRETPGTARCGNGYAGQSGLKDSCEVSGQTVMSPRSVWMLTHYGSNAFTEVTSCGARAGEVLPYFAGEVRFRELRCDDGVRGPGESDVDCGGACGACVAGDTCQTADDCESDVCTAGVCAAATCADGVQNGGETSIDCGGPCTASCPQLSCASILASGRSRGTGEYTVDPDGAGTGAPLRVWCDMDTDGGGWTLVARASDTNGVAGDYEFRAVFGAQSLLSRSASGGSHGDAQFFLALERVVPSVATTIDLQYYCYDARSPSTTRYWSKVRALGKSTLFADLGASNPDFLYSNVRVDNADGVTSTTGSFAFFGRETTGNARCGNGYAGQSGIKYSCTSSGQTVMSPRSVWMLTHYGSYGYTEVTSCGAVAGSALPYYVGEVRFR